MNLNELQHIKSEIDRINRKYGIVTDSKNNTSADNPDIYQLRPWECGSDIKTYDAGIAKPGSWSKIAGIKPIE